MSQQPIRRIFLREFKILSHAISTYDDLNLLMGHIAERICQSFEVKGCSIMLFDEREKQLFRVSSCGVSDEYLDKGPVMADDRYSAFVTGTPVFIENMQDDPRVQYREAARREGIASMLSVPITFRKAPLGVIRIYHSDRWDLHEDDLDSFSVLADHLGLAIENNGLINFLEKVKHAMETLPLRLLDGL